MNENRHRNEITAFIVENNIIRVIGTDHAIQRLDRRSVDKYHVASACLGLGKKLLEYNNSGNHIMLIDEGKNLSCVLTVENYTVVLITVLEKANVYVKENTLVENFQFKVAN
jgi:hypothetical protein